MRKTILKKLDKQGLIANYNRVRKNRPSHLPQRVVIWDETFGEGVKTPTVFLTYVEKVKIAKMMDDMGVSLISLGRPSVSGEAKHSIQRIVNEGFEKATLTASAKTNKKEVDDCIECGVREIVLSTSMIKLRNYFLLH